MSAGGVFKLIANDGKADRMIMATELLNQRIKDIMCMRARQGFQDPTPTLVDIERTHILYVNSHFKPFAAIGYEYNKVNPNSGTPTFGGDVQFSIPQFGDFFADMVINAVLAPVACTAGTVPAFPADIGTSSASTVGNSRISYTNDTVAGVCMRYTYTYVDANDNALAVGSAATNFIRYCEYPGERLFAKVKFEVNGNPLDDYDVTAMIFKQKYGLLPNKVVGWKRLVGQEVPVEAYSDLSSIQGSAGVAAAASNLVAVTGAPALASINNAQDTSRKLISIVNGAQTAKASQPLLDMWIPLIFWFNTDSRLSIPSVSIPYGQRFITVTLQQQANLVFPAPGNLFLKLEVQRQVSAGTDKGLPTALAVQDVQTWTTYVPTLATGSVVNTTQTIQNLSLYINNIFVNPEIHDIYIKRIGFSLIRVHRYQSNAENVATDNFLLSNLKWPIEYMYVALQPQYNTSSANPNQYRDWDRFTLLTDQDRYQLAKSRADVMIDDSVAYNAVSAKHKTNTSAVACGIISYPTSTQTIDTIQLQAHGINIFQQTDSQFFRDYMPYIFGGINVTTPEDPGAYFLNFCLYPGTYQPSGHINISRAREFYIQYTSSYCSSTNPCNLIIMAKAINFLLISDGSAVLRYST
jgi:Large eukaryotic DNA virus major capsid protein